MQKEIDWNFLIKKAAAHGLTAFFYFHINSISTENIPPEALKKLKESFNRIFQKNLFLTRELLNILDYLNKNGITVMPYKGPFLALMTNQNLSLRRFGDLDFLIDKKDFKKVKQLLESTNYTPKFNLYPGIEDTFTKYQNEFHFMNKNSGIHLDLHWNPLNINYTFPTDPSILWDLKPIERNIEGFNIISLPIEELILILSLHSASHFWNRLSWLCDIFELIRNQSELNWDNLLKKARLLSLEKILLINLLLTNDLLDLELPEIVFKSIENQKSVNEISSEVKMNFLNDEYPSGLKEAFFQIRLRDKKWYGFKDCMNMLFRPTWEEWENYKPTRYSYPLYYFLRPFRVLKKYVFKQRSEIG